MDRQITLSPGRYCQKGNIPDHRPLLNAIVSLRNLEKITIVLPPSLNAQFERMLAAAEPLMFPRAQSLHISSNSGFVIRHCPSLTHLSVTNHEPDACPNEEAESIAKIVLQARQRPDLTSFEYTSRFSDKLCGPRMLHGMYSNILLIRSIDA